MIKSSMILILMAGLAMSCLVACAPQAQYEMLDRNVSGLQIETHQLSERIKTLEQRMAKLDTQNSQGKSGPVTIARLNVRVDRLESELMRMNGLLEQIQYNQERQRQRLDLLYDRLNLSSSVYPSGGTPQLQQPQDSNPPAVNSRPPSQQVATGSYSNNIPSKQSSVRQNGQDMSSSGSRVQEGMRQQAGSQPGPSTQRPQVMNSESGASSDEQVIKKSFPDALYDRGRELFKKKKYQEAKGFFRDFIRQNPGSPKVPNAYFWIGECEYKMSRFEEAILAYNKVLNKFPKSSKVPDALLKQGFAFAKLGDNESARILLKKLVREYPSSPQAKIAKRQLMLLR